MYSLHRWSTIIRQSCPSLTDYLYAHKTIEDRTGAEEAGVELASKVDRIKYTGKAGWEMPHQFWLIKTLPRLSQTKQNTTRWLPELCTAKPHDTRNGEDTRGNLQVLFLCTIKLAVLIADISNIYRHLQYCICFWIFFSGFGCKSPADTLQGSYLDSEKVYY